MVTTTFSRTPAATPAVRVARAAYSVPAIRLGDGMSPGVPAPRARRRNTARFAVVAAGMALVGLVAGAGTASATESTNPISASSSTAYYTAAVTPSPVKITVSDLKVKKALHSADQDQF